jgi:hypothetical protein
MERIQYNQIWSLFCPGEAPGLADVWGEEFRRLYEQYEGEGRARRCIRAQDLWFAILQVQMETGMPSIVRPTNLISLSVSAKKRTPNR